MQPPYSREIKFEEILNFRDLGGYQTRDNRLVAWRRLFRSGELHCMTARDEQTLLEELKINTIIDLRSAKTVQGLGLGRVKEMKARYINAPMALLDEYDVEQKTPHHFNSMHEEYLFRVKNKGYGKSFVAVLNIIADPANHPVVYHCNAGADRSGILSAIILDTLGVADADIEADYGLTQNALPKFIARWNNNPATADVHKNLPDIHLKLNPKAITALLANLRREYGSVQGYLESFGAEVALFSRLQKALLV